MNYVNKIERVWKHVFNRLAVIEIESQNPLTIRVGPFTLVQTEGEEIRKSVKGTERVKAMGWSADVFVSSYSPEWGEDGDVVDLGWRRSFDDALILIVETRARDMAYNFLLDEGMVESLEEDKKILETSKG